MNLWNQICNVLPKYNSGTGIGLIFLFQKREVGKKKGLCNESQISLKHKASSIKPQGLRITLFGLMLCHPVPLGGYYPHDSVQLSRSVISHSLWPHVLQHTRPPCPSPIPGACSNSCPSSWWCHPTISSSVVPFLSCLQSCPSSGSFPMSQFFPLGSQSIGASAFASVLLMNMQDWFPLR